MENNITHETPIRSFTAPRRAALSLALAATITALSISTLAGWQRGGLPAERIVWVGISLVLVLSAHLLPAIVRGAPIAVRSIASLLWIACMATACFGHGTFFLLAQRHAGEFRASVIPAVPVTVPSRDLAVVMTERATVIRQLASARARYCVGNCATLEARRVTLAARLDALDTEADDMRRRRATDDRVTQQHDALLADPVTTRLATLLGVSVARVDLLSGLTFAAVLEGLACLLWTVALRAPPVRAPSPAATSPLAALVTDVPRATQETVTPGASGHTASTVTREMVTGRHASRDDPVAPLPGAGPDDDDVRRLAIDVAAGRVRPTVSGIRRHLGCSQSRAATLRRQLAARNVTA